VLMSTRPGSTCEATDWALIEALPVDWAGVPLEPDDPPEVLPEPKLPEPKPLEPLDEPALGRALIVLFDGDAHTAWPTTTPVPAAMATARVPTAISRRPFLFFGAGAGAGIGGGGGHELYGWAGCDGGSW